MLNAPGLTACKYKGSPTYAFSTQFFFTFHIHIFVGEFGLVELNRGLGTLTKLQTYHAPNTSKIGESFLCMFIVQVL